MTPHRAKSTSPSCACVLLLALLATLSCHAAAAAAAASTTAATAAAAGAASSSSSASPGGTVQNTPGGVRVLDGSEEQQQLQAQQALQLSGTAGVVVDAAGSPPDGAAGFDSSQLLFQSLPTFPEAEAKALATFSGMLRSPGASSRPLDSTLQHADGSGGGGSTPSPVSAADDFIASLLRTTRASLAGSRPLRRVRKPAAASSSSALGDSDGGEAQAASSEGDSDAVAAAVDDGDDDSDSTSTDSPEDSSSSIVPDPESAVDGQMLVTEAEIIPALQAHQYGQVVVESLKMRPILAQDLSKAADTPGADATAWQDGLKQSLEAAAALEANVSVTHIHTKMTCILNMGLELAEPPLPAASAAAAALATSIKELAGDESVLVGVSLIRLGPGSGANASSSTAAAPARPAASNSSSLARVAGPDARIHGGSNSVLALLTLYNMGEPANAVLIAQRMQLRCPELFAIGAGLNATTCGQGLLDDYESAILVASTAAVQARAQQQQQLAGERAAPKPDGGNDAPKRALLQLHHGAGHAHAGGNRAAGVRPHLDGLGSILRGDWSPFSVRLSDGAKEEEEEQEGGDSAEEESSPTGKRPAHEDSADAPEPQAAAREQQGHAQPAAAPAASSSSIRVRQQPEVNIIITQAVGVSGSEAAGAVASKLQALSSSSALKQLLALSGLTLAQAGKPQVVDLQAAAAAGLTTSSAIAAAAAAAAEASTGHAGGAASTGSGASGAPGGPGIAAWVAVAVAVSVVAVCAAAVTIVVVKQRAKHSRAARAAAAEPQDELPHSSKSKRRRGSGKGGKPVSKYLPSHAILLPPMPGCSSEGGMPPSPCVIVTAVASPSHHHTPRGASGLSPLKPWLPGSQPPAGGAFAGAGSSPGPRLEARPGSSAPGTPAHASAGPPLPLARGDSVSSAVMAELTEQQQEEAERDGHTSGSGSGSSSGSEDSDHEGAPGAALPACHSYRLQRLDSSGSSWSISMAHEQRSPAGATPRAHHQQQQQRFTHIRDGGSPASPLSGSRIGAPQHRTPQHPQQQQPPQLVQSSSWGPASEAAAPQQADATGNSSQRADSLRLFSRPLSESSLPEDLRLVLASSGATASSAREAGGSSSDSGRARLALEQQPLQQPRPGSLLITARQDTLGSSTGGSPGSSRLGVRASPFMCYSASALAAAAAEAGAAASSSSVSAARLASQSSAASVGTAGAGAAFLGHESTHEQQWASMQVAPASALRAAAAAAAAAHAQLQDFNQLQEEPSTAAASPQRLLRPSPFMARGNVPPGLG